MNKIRIGVIPAAGKGGRISPLSKILPKPMIPVLDQPILEFVIKRMVYEFGIEEVYLIVGHMSDVIKNYFKDGKEIGIKIKYVYQNDPKGIAQAIGLTEKYIKEPFMVMLGDDFTIGSTKELMNTFFKKNAYVVEAMINEEDKTTLKRTCCARINNEKKIEEIIEKPKNPISNIRGCGIYIFDPIVFDYLKKMPASAEEKGITEIIREISKDGKAYGELLKGVNVNINTKEDLFLANLILAHILEKEKKIDMEKIKRFLERKYNENNNSFFKKMGIIK
ncbi:MAG: nucleotidyltransferase family protein [archaeon]